MQASNTIEIQFGGGPGGNNARLRRSGSQCGRALRIAKEPRRWKPRFQERSRRLQAIVQAAAANRLDSNSVWLLDNLRLIRGNEKETRQLPRSLRRFALAVDETGELVPRVCCVAREYLTAAKDQFSEEGLTCFLEGYLRESDLAMGEIWALIPGSGRRL